MTESESGKDSKASQLFLHIAAIVAVIAGAIGMVASFLYLSMADSRDIAAGSSGFIAGAILIGSGLISLSVLFRRTP